MSIYGILQRFTRIEKYISQPPRGAGDLMSDERSAAERSTKSPGVALKRASVKSSELSFCSIRAFLGPGGVRRLARIPARSTQGVFPSDGGCPSPHDYSGEPSPAYGIVHTRTRGREDAPFAAPGSEIRSPAQEGEGRLHDLPTQKMRGPLPV